MPKLICIRKSLTQFVSPLICNHLPWEPKSSLKSPSAELRFLEKVGVRGIVPSMAQAWDAMEIHGKGKPLQLHSFDLILVQPQAEMLLSHTKT